MAEETTTQNTNTVHQLTDTVLEEIKKVSELEKGLSFLQARQGAVERSVTELRKLTERQGAGEIDDKNVINEDDDKKETPEDKKKEKDVIKQDKIKPNLESFEKKRYEAIGVEFAKGTEKVFNEIKKSQELKQKMTISKVEKIEEKKEEKEEEKPKEEKKKMSLLQLSLAITAVSGILYLFREGIDSIIPGFKSGYENVLSPLKNIGEKLFGNLIDNVTSAFENGFDLLFGNEEDSIKQTFKTFFLTSLPDVLYQSGVALFNAFGGTVSTNMRTMTKTEIEAADAALKKGQEQDAEEKRYADLADEASKNAAIRGDVFATTGQIEKAYRQLGRDIIVGAGLDTVLSTLYGVEAKTIAEFASYSNSFISLVNDYSEKYGTKLKDEEFNQFAAALWKSRGGKTHFINGEETEEFGHFKSSIKVTTQDNWSKFVDAAKSFNDAAVGKSKLEEDKKKLTQIQNQTMSNVKSSALAFDPKDDSEIKLNIKPMDIMESEFGAEIADIFTTFKNLFTGENDFTFDKITDIAINFIKEIIDKLIDPLVSSIGNFVNFVTPTVGATHVNIPTANSHSVLDIALGKKSSAEMAEEATLNSPVILLDLDLNGNILASISQMFEKEDSLLKTMEETNKKLEGIRNLVEDTPVSDGSIRGLGKQQLINIREIPELAKRVGNIEDYLEKTDNDGTDDEDIKFSLDIPQAKSTSQQ